ncbi:MAG: hypothetical protein AB7E32_16985 [Desulfovibrio sp.]
MRKYIFMLSAAFLVCVLLFDTAEAGKKNIWPQDARDVSATLYQRMIGKYDGSGNVHFDPKGSQEIEGGTSGGFAGFDDGNTFFMHYANDAAGKTYNAEVLGLFNISDKFGRTAALRFFADYKVMFRDIMIKESMTVTASPPRIVIQTYLVSAELVEANLSTAFDDWTTLYKFVTSNAYKAGQEADIQRWFVFSFAMNKLPVDANLDVYVSSKRTANQNSQNDGAAKQKMLDYSGWRVHVFAAKFKPCSARGRFYINYYYTPGADVPDDIRERVLAAQFDSKR